ncbi:LADA_0E11914g1_1 [Lachancea dasiensis]|uniref:Mediator of RNA polymerase II transcription subunit 5 n=1 Tax=Lachancea dasiensis TaxID=1072105 RepID=A0A1G4JEQ4_9SACH|nr:LADA_0E11914g1_1 [Lachancea dasiensis]
MDEKRDSIIALALNCSKRRLPATQFLNFYNELVNDQFGNFLTSSEDVQTHENNIDVYEELSTCLLQILESGVNILSADYVTEVIFINYNSQLVQRFLPQLHKVQNSSHLALLFAKASAFFLNLDDKLVVDQICADLATLILPSIFTINFASQTDEVILAAAKFIRNVLKLSTHAITITDLAVKEGVTALLGRISKTHKLLYRKLSKDLESHVNYVGHAPNLFHQEALQNLGSPSVLSPKRIDTLPTSPKNSNISNLGNSSHRSIKLTRYCKNLWLNNKVMNWSTNERDFISSYGVIEVGVQKLDKAPHNNVESVLVDLIETSFTSFAQFVTNQQYHQPNAHFNLLERQWTIFITKQLPLYLLEHAPRKSEIVTTALENIDHKVIKALRQYTSEKDESKNGGEDLFEDVPNKNMDIRHEFLRNLINIGLLPPSIFNDYLRDDQVVDVKSLPSSDNVTFTNAQGVKESITNFSRFIKDKMGELDLESIFDQNGGTFGNAENGIIQIIRKFDTLASTKQRDLAELFYELFCESAKNFDCRNFSKVCCLMSLNLCHSLTSMLTFVSPHNFLTVAIQFIDETWDANVKAADNGMSDEFEPNTEFVCFTYALIFVIHITKTYEIPLVDMISTNIHISPDSFTVKLISELGNVPPPPLKQDDNGPSKVLENWVRDLFVNGSISDSLMKSADAKELATFIPYIFKQSVLSVESGLVKDITALTGGFEYFLQPFLIVGMVGIVFWAEQCLNSLRSQDISKEILDSVLEMLSTVLNPSSLNNESKPLHTLILRLNSAQLLKAARALRTRSRSNYGMYSSEGEGDPRLGSIISLLEDIARAGNLYNVDPLLLTSENGYQKKEIGYYPFLITAENSINSIITNQVNSFWNLQSSTYYNLDYLFALVDIVTPATFLRDVLNALYAKASDPKNTGHRRKDTDGEGSNSLDYLFYFMVTHDLKKSTSKVELLRFLESASEVESDTKKTSVDTQAMTKPEQAPDEDFDMLFGEDTSLPGNETNMTADDYKVGDVLSPKALYLLKNSFFLPFKIWYWQTKRLWILDPYIKKTTNALYPYMTSILIF